MNEFPTAFKALTGNAPFPWQQALYNRLLEERDDNIPKSCNLPTGLGKTSVIAVWLIALANGANVPRRLVYVVNRRTVVDQTTDEVTKYRKAIDEKLELAPLKAWLGEALRISTLRGQFADNREWSADPARPAVICGTVDMIGSRLLFSGYGVGFKAKPLHAGFLGQDALIVHDEAHLEPAFQELLIAIENEQKRCKDFKPLRVMELTATSRSGGKPFTITAVDEANPEVDRRIHAGKTLAFHEVADEKKQLAGEILKLALAHQESHKAILVFVRTVENLNAVVTGLQKAKCKVQQLTGTLRGLERDELVNDVIFKRFLPGAETAANTVYLVCTSAGEVGVNISADHLVCDLTPFESMAQRFGRVNRFGICSSTRIDVVHPSAFDDDIINVRRQRTLALLQSLNGIASPAALGNLDAEARKEAFTPPPTILPTSDILFDAWALTSIRGKLPGRPEVDPYLHGLEDDQPQTTFAWREEVDYLDEETLAANGATVEEALEIYPLKPHETLTVPTHGKGKAFEQLEMIAERDAKLDPKEQRFAWLVEPNGDALRVSIQSLIVLDKNKRPARPLGGRTIILPPKAGGLQAGLLVGDVPYDKETRYDVADDIYTDTEKVNRRRIRKKDVVKHAGMRLIRRFVIPAGDDDAETQGPTWFWFARPFSSDDDRSKSDLVAVTWHRHTDHVEQNIRKFIASLKMPDLPADALIAAALAHDLGKKRVIWQRSIGNPNPSEWYAKSDPDWTIRELTDFRHEFGSLLDLNPDADDLVRHLIAAHHGRGRPHFPTDEVFDPDHTPAEADAEAAKVPQRFARLQRKYGRWGLAYLESLLRAADYAASAKPSKFVEESS